MLTAEAILKSLSQKQLAQLIRHADLDFRVWDSGENPEEWKARTTGEAAVGERICDAMNDHNSDVCQYHATKALATVKHGWAIETVLASVFGRGLVAGWKAALSAMEVHQLQGMTTYDKLTKADVLELAKYIEKQDRVFMCGYTDDLAAHVCRFVARPLPFPESHRAAAVMLPAKWLNVGDWSPDWKEMFWELGRVGQEKECLVLFLEEHAEEL